MSIKSLRSPDPPPEARPRKSGRLQGDRVARAVGAFAFRLKGVETQSVIGKDAVREIYQGEIRLWSFDSVAGRQEQRIAATKEVSI